MSCDISAYLTICFNLSRDITWLLVTYPPQIATRYDMSECDVKTMFSIISGTFQYILSEGISLGLIFFQNHIIW